MQDTETIKHGKVSSIDPDKATARVTFPDFDELVSYALPVMMFNTGFMQVFSMPQVNQPVKCSFSGTGLEDGFIDGGFYNDENPPPTNDPDLHMIKFKDGTTIVYNAADKSITISAQGGVTFNADVTINGNVTATGDVVANSAISLASHIHSNVKSGTEVSGGPL